MFYPNNFLGRLLVDEVEGLFVLQMDFSLFILLLLHFFLATISPEIVERLTVHD